MLRTIGTVLTLVWVAVVLLGPDWWVLLITKDL
jgi:hypothetical protein